MKHLRTPLRALGFLALLCALLFYIEGIFFERDGTAMPFYAEPENSIDVVFLGSSKTNAAISPTQLFDEYGFTSYTLFNWSQTPWAMFHYAKEALKTQTPKAIVVEANSFLYGSISEELTNDINAVTDINALKIPFSLNRLSLAYAMQESQTNRPSFFTSLSIYKYHANWKGVTGDDFFWFLQETQPSANKGFGPLYLTESFPSSLPTAAPTQQALYPAAQTYLDKMIALCDNADIALVFVNYPSNDYTESDRAFLSKIGAYCTEHGATYLDYGSSETLTETGLSYETDFADYSHVNYLGAEKVTHAIGTHLIHANLALENHKDDPRYADWHEALAINQKDVQNMHVRLASTPVALCDRAANEDYLMLLYANGDMTAADGTAIANELSAFGIPSEIFAETAAQTLWVLSDGQFKEIEATSESGSENTYTTTLADVTIVANGNSVLANGIEQSYQREGINALVFERSTGKLIQSITWATEHNYTPYTK